MKKNNEFMTAKEAEEYYQTMKDAKAFQQCLGLLSIILGLAIVFLAGIGEGFLFVVLGIYLIVTKEIVVTMPREEEE